MQELARQFPDPKMLIRLEPEELAAVVLSKLKVRFHPRLRDCSFYRDNLISELAQNNGPLAYAGDQADQAQRACMEAFAWLERQGLIVPAVGHQPGRYVLSRRAELVQSDTDFRRFVVESRFQKELLHPTIIKEAWPAFIRGELSAAVFQAMRAVEIAVRDASGLEAGKVGTKLMGAAFHRDCGPLTDKAREIAERDSLMMLFWGAIGSYKNPHSHRDVDLTDPAEATEIMFLASHLLRIVDARRPQV